VTLTDKILPLAYLIVGGFFLAIAGYGIWYVINMFGLQKHIKNAFKTKKSRQIPEEIYEQVAIWMKERDSLPYIVGKISNLKAKTQRKYIDAYLQLKEASESPKIANKEVLNDG